MKPRGEGVTRSNREGGGRRGGEGSVGRTQARDANLPDFGGRVRRRALPLGVGRGSRSSMRRRMRLCEARPLRDSKTD